MADLRLYLCCSILFFFLGRTFHFGIQSVCGFPRHKPTKCLTDGINNNTIDLKCMDGSLIHVIKETYLNSSSSDNCTSDCTKCNGLTVENNKISSTNFRLQTVCNRKTNCNETLDQSYFNCTGRRMGRVDYECVPESVNYNMCDNLTASSNIKLNESVFYLESPTSGTSDPILCDCEIRGKNIRVQIVDFIANMMEKEKWFLNITSGFMLNDSTPPNSPIIRLLNNVLGGYHDTVHIMYYSENTSNQNIWIELIGSRDVQMNLSCTSWIYSTTRNPPNTPQTSIPDTHLKPSTTHSTNMTENSAAKYNTTFTSAFENTTSTVNTSSQMPTVSMSTSVENTTSTVNKSSQMPTESMPTSVENTTSTVNKSSQMPTVSMPTSAENTTSTEVTTNHSGAYSSGQSSGRENDQQTIVISVVVVAVASFVSAVVAAVAIVYRKRRNDYKSRFSEFGEHPVPQTNLNAIETKVNHKHENSSKCVPEEELKDNFLYSMDDTEFKDSHICVPEEEMKDNFLYSMDDTEFQDSQICVPEEEMKDNFLYSMEDTEFQDSQKCVPEKEMKDNFLYSMDDTEFQDSQICVPEEEMKDNFLYSMDDTKF